jgi:hypothetical protein
MKPEDKEILIEAANSAFRERAASGQIRPSAEWWDLSPDERVEAFDRGLESRLIEKAVDPNGLSTTARAVLSRIDPAPIPDLD